MVYTVTIQIIGYFIEINGGQLIGIDADLIMDEDGKQVSIRSEIR